MPALIVQRLIAERDQAIRKLHEQGSSDSPDAVYQEQKRYFARIDRTLDACRQGPDWLKQNAIAELVAAQIKSCHNESYDLLAYCIMPNHVHLVVDTVNQLDNLLSDEAITSTNYQQLYRTLGLIKGRSAYQANQLLNRKGPFWQPESYDHWVRNGVELKRIIHYVLQNPVKAGLVASWEEWPWTFLSDRF